LHFQIECKIYGVFFKGQNAILPDD